jgi:hypothetical protein
MEDVLFDKVETLSTWRFRAYCKLIPNPPHIGGEAGGGAETGK